MERPHFALCDMEQNHDAAAHRGSGSYANVAFTLAFVPRHWVSRPCRRFYWYAWGRNEPPEL